MDRQEVLHIVPDAIEVSLSEMFRANNDHQLYDSVNIKLNQSLGKLTRPQKFVSGGQLKELAKDSLLSL